MIPGNRACWRLLSAMATMACSIMETAREPDHHEGKDHGGGLQRGPASPAIAVMLVAALVCPLFRPVIPNAEQFAMSGKVTVRNETPWRARGFKKPNSGTKAFTFQECIFF